MLAKDFFQCQSRIYTCLDTWLAYVYLTFQPVCARAVGLYVFVFLALRNGVWKLKELRQERQHFYFCEDFCRCKQLCSCLPDISCCACHGTHTVQWILTKALLYEDVYRSNPSYNGISYFPISLIASLTEFINYSCHSSKRRIPLSASNSVKYTWILATA